MKAKPKKPGRKPIDPALVRKNQVGVYLTDAEMLEATARAKAAGQTIAAWLIEGRFPRKNEPASE